MFQDIWHSSDRIIRKMSKTHPHYHAAKTALKQIYRKLITKDVFSAADFKDEMLEWGKYWSDVKLPVPMDKKQYVQYAGKRK